MGKCGDCGAEEGQYHEYGCDMERCPFCGGQLITCDCCYKYLGYNIRGKEEMMIEQQYLKDGTRGLPMDVYENGLPDDQEEEWHRILERRGRIRWIDLPILCVKCGKQYPDFFHDTDWDKYIPSIYHSVVLCKDCWDSWKKMVNNGCK